MGHDHEIPKVPSPDMYKVEDIPSLMEVQRLLAERGLKNPWLRNDVWRYQEMPYGRAYAIRVNLLRGFRIAIPLIVLTLGIEKYYGIDYGHHPNMHGRDYY